MPLHVQVLKRFRIIVLYCIVSEQFRSASGRENQWCSQKKSREYWLDFGGGFSTELGRILRQMIISIC